MIFNKKMILLSVFTLFLTACGGGGTSDVSQDSGINIDNTTTTGTTDNTTTSDSNYLLPTNNVKGISIVANANVDIFKFNADRTLTKLFTEATDTTGIFDTHSSELLEGYEDYYLYQITGGHYMDGTPNTSTLRLITLGKEVKKRIYEEPLFITPISEYLYITVMEWIEQHPIDDQHANYLYELGYRYDLFIEEIFGLSPIDGVVGYFDPEKKINWYTDTLPSLYVQVEDDLRNGHDDYAHRPQSLYKYWGAKDRVDHGSPMDLTMSLDEKKIFLLEDSTYVGTDNNGNLAEVGYSGLNILDISDKSTINVIHEHFIRNPLHLQISDDQKLAYVIYDDVDHVQTELHKLTLKIINIESLNQPYEIGSLLIKEFLNENRVAKEAINDMLLANNNKKLYLSYIDHLQGSLIEIDISDPTSPIIGEQVSLDVPFGHTKLSKDESKIYATDSLEEDGFFIYDIASKSVLGQLATTYADLFTLSSDEKTAFLSIFGTLTIVDIQDPGTPKIISEFEGCGDTLLLSPDGTKLYTSKAKEAFEMPKLLIINIRDLTKPEAIYHSDAFVTYEGSRHQGTALITSDGKTGYFGDLGQHLISTPPDTYGTINLHTVDLSTQIAPIQ